MFGALYGALLILLFYGLIIAAKACLTVYDGRVVYVASLTFFMTVLNGLANLHGWPEVPHL